MASDQLAYAPARPEGDTAQERDDFRMPRPRGAADHADPGAEFTPGFTPGFAPAFTPGLAAMAGAAGSGAAGLAVFPAPLPPAAPMPLPDAGPGASFVAVPGYDPKAVTLPAPLPPAAPSAGERPPVVPVFEERTAADAPNDAALEPLPAADPGEALCARILGEATARREAAARAEREAAEQAAAAQAAREAAERKVRERAAAAKAAAEAKAREEAEEAARAEAERLARLAESYIKPVTSCTLGAGFGEADPWANLHAGQDFTAPTGTPVHAVHGGTVTSAGWAGSFGYRVVQTLDDGTELWYCHLSTMVTTGGRVTTGDTVGRVGATGNVPAPHLHLEVRPGGGAPIDPLPWLREHGVGV